MYGRHALAACRWQWYISDQNTVTKYQPLQSNCLIHCAPHSLYTLWRSFAIACEQEKMPGNSCDFARMKIEVEQKRGSNPCDFARKVRSRDTVPFYIIYNFRPARRLPRLVVACSSEVYSIASAFSASVSTISS